MESYYTNQASALPFFRGTIGKEVADLELYQVVSEELLYLLQEDIFYQQQNVLEKNFCYRVCQS